MPRHTLRSTVRVLRRYRRGWFAAVSSLVATAIVVGLIACERAPLAPRAGLPEYRAIATMALPGPARLDVAGGNLLVSRTDLELDTQLGPFSVGAIWNSASRRWTWNFDDISFANGSFVDGTGATHSIGALAPGTAIAGSIWVKVSQAGQSGPNRLKTKGGLEYTFTTAGRPLSIRWTSSENPSLRFTQSLQGDGALHTTAIEQCIGETVECHPVFTIDYDAAGRVREIIDRAGRRALFTYDAAGQLATARDGLDSASDRPGYRYEYDGGDLTAITNSEGERVEYAYDGARRLLRSTQIGAGNPMRFFEYRTQNGSTPYRTIATDPLGAERVYGYDGNHQLLAVEDVQLAETTTFTWSERRITARTTPSGTTTYWAYANDDVAFQMEPNRNITRYTYQSDGVDRAFPGRRPLLRRSDSLGTLEERSYDGAGRLISIANGAGDTLSLEYGTDQMVTAFTDPAGISASLSGYGAHGHATSVSRAGRSQNFVFDVVGNMIEGPDLESDSGPGRGGIVSRDFDEDRNVKAIALTDLVTGLSTTNETVVTVFRSDRQPLLVVRPGGGDDRFVYDELGRLVRRRQRADGVWHDTTFDYDAAGRTTAVDLPNGMGQRWTYDSLGRVTSHVIRNESVTENVSAFVWQNGVVERHFDSRSGTEVYSYDGAGRIDAVVYGNGDRATLSWDLRSRQTGVTLERGDGSMLRTIGISYDDAGRESAVYDNGVPVIERSWSSGRLSRTEYGNGLVRDFTFDADLGSLAGALMTAGSLTAESTVVKASDPECIPFASQCVSSRTTSEGALPMTTSEFHYLMPSDSNSRAGKRVGLEEAVNTAGRPYVYDVLSNLRVGPAGDLTYNEEENRLQAIALDHGSETMHYEYDSAGFATSRGGEPMTWDGAGRVASYGDATFEWDGVGRPVTSTIEGVHTTRRFGGLVEADATGQPTAIDLGEVRIDLTASGTRYRHFDYRGNVKLVTDATGEVVQHYEYSAYAVEAVYGSDTDNRSFARGQAVGDLVLIGHRLYDPAAARFLAPDPIYQLINQYAYTLGNPLQFWDPSGLQAVTNDQTAGAMMQAAGNTLSIIGGVTLGIGLGAVFVPAAGVVTAAALIGIGVNLVVLGEGLDSIGGLLLQSGGGGSISPGDTSGFGIFAPLSFNQHVGFTCGAEPCSGGGGQGGNLSEIQALANLGGPTRGLGGGGGGGAGCAPISLAEGRVPKGSFGLLLLANLAVASIVCRRARFARCVTRNA